MMWLTLLLAGPFQVKPPEGPDPARVDAAITRGISYLREHVDSGQPYRHGPLTMRTDELVLWTLLHAGVAESDLLFQKLLERMFAGDLDSTYRVALQAMVLEELDRVKHQKQIWRCAQFLVDNQCRSGQWSYGEKTIMPDFPLRDVASGKGEADTARGEGKKPPVRTKVPVRSRRQGTGEGDLSNSQYAALGLRACFDAGIVLPWDLVERAAQSWRDLQNGNKEIKKGKAVSTGAQSWPEPRGWGYNRKLEDDQGTTGSMTAGAIGSLAIVDRILGTDARKDENILAGISWLTRNYSVETNPKEASWHLYYLYALERAGIFLDMDRYGTHPWYAEGAKLLLGSQHEGGGWWSGGWTPGQDLFEPAHVWETCFAILFLKRAARPLKDVASVDRFHDSERK